MRFATVAMLTVFSFTKEKTAELVKCWLSYFEHEFPQHLKTIAREPVINMPGGHGMKLLAIPVLVLPLCSAYAAITLIIGASLFSVKLFTAAGEKTCVFLLEKIFVSQYVCKS